MQQEYHQFELQAISFSKYLVKTFAWMIIGLLITAASAYFMARYAIYYVANVWVTLGVFAAQLVVVLWLNHRIDKMNSRTATFWFIAYSLLMGVTFSVYLMLFHMDTIALAFGFAALLFINMAIIGLTTRRDLSKFGMILFVGVITLLIMSIIGLFINLSALEMILCYVGIGIFLAIVAYDMQRLRMSYVQFSQDDEQLKKASIIDALGLYLDFLNIFVYIIRLLANRD